MIYVSQIEWEEKDTSLPEEVTLQLSNEGKDDSDVAESIFEQLFMKYGTEAKTFTFSEGYL